MLLQHFANGLIAPSGRLAAKEQAFRVVVLTLRYCRLQLGHAMLCDVLHCGLLVGFVGWPLIGQQQMLNFFVGPVVWQGFAEVLEVSVEVNVFLRDAAHMRKAMRI